jgi:hypothetical protein
MLDIGTKLGKNINFKIFNFNFVYQENNYIWNLEIELFSRIPFLKSVNMKLINHKVNTDY